MMRYTLLVAGVLCPVPLSASEVGPDLQRSFIWPASASAGKQAYVEFRKCLEVSEAPTIANIHVFADSRYLLWINGEYVTRGPCRFDPKAPEYDSLDVTRRLHRGTNVLAVLVHHYHDGLKADDPTPMNGRTMRHVPGLSLVLQVTGADGSVQTIRTDPSWQASSRTPYKPVGPSWGGIPDDVDARLQKGNWTLLGFDDSGWEHPQPVDGKLWGPLHPRAIPLLREIEVVPARIVRQTGGTGQFPRPLQESLPAELREKQELVIDVGRMVLAYDLIDLDAVEGTCVEVAHGHGYSNGKPDEVFTTNRYIARAGRQVYLSSDTTGFQYLMIRVTSGRATIHGVKVVNRVYPFDCLGRFTCNDPFLNELWVRSLNTIQLCSEDGYTDCSGRERTEWMGDAAICEYPVTRVALAGPGVDAKPCYADPRLIRNMLRHIAVSQQSDGRLKAHHPSDRWDIHGYIEDYSCLWAQTLTAYYRNTDDVGLVRELWPCAVRQLKWFLDHRTPNGLVKAREFVFVDNPLCYKTCEGTTLNASVVGYLRNAAFLAGVLRDAPAAEAYLRSADELVGAINRNLWDEKNGTYDGGILDGRKMGPTVHAGILALYHGIVPDAQRGRVRQHVLANLGQVGSPYSAHFLFEVLYGIGTAQTDELVLRFIREKWAPVLARKDNDTVYEGFGSGSLCHNIGAVPAYYLGAWVLGVRREGTLAEKRIYVEPHLGDLTAASGVVLNELGAVSVNWERDSKTRRLTFRCEIPDGAQAILALPVAEGTTSLTLDAKQVSCSPATTGGGRVRLVVGPGIHTGQVMTR
jgi:alpha-L-rhamnosidase